MNSIRKLEIDGERIKFHYFDTPFPRNLEYEEVMNKFFKEEFITRAIPLKDILPTYVGIKKQYSPDDLRTCLEKYKEDLNMNQKEKPKTYIKFKDSESNK